MRERTALYRLFAEDGTLLYIGITSNPSDRWNTHRCDTWWWPMVASKRLEWFETRVEAAKAEAAAIRAEVPLHNKAIPDEDGLGGYRIASPRAKVPAISGRYRNFRLGADWDRFGDAVARAEPELDRSKVLREFVRWYIGEAEDLPRRPSGPPKDRQGEADGS